MIWARLHLLRTVVKRAILDIRLPGCFRLRRRAISPKGFVFNPAGSGFPVAPRLCVVARVSFEGRVRHGRDRDVGLFLCGDAWLILTSAAILTHPL
jgi:hypothetical protein